MPLAVTHVLTTIILLDLYRDYIMKSKKLMPLNTIFIGGVAGLLPDIDIPLYWLLTNVLGLKVQWFHATITHTIWIPIIILAAALITAKYRKKTGVLLGVVSFGLIVHIILDFALRGTIMPLWPLSQLTITGLMANSAVMYWDLGLDALILLAWFWHEEKKHRISDFI